MLMDFLPPAWTVVKKLKKGTAHLCHHGTVNGPKIVISIYDLCLFYGAALSALYLAKLFVSLVNYDW